MTQCIIPGCEANPDPATVINVDPTKPMKEIPMSETKSNIDNNDAFKNFIAAGSSIVQSGRELMEENARLRASNERLLKEYDAVSEVLLNHNIKDAAALEEILSEPVGSSEPPADYQTLKDFKGEMDAIHEEFDIEKDVGKLREALEEWKDMKRVCDYHSIDPDVLEDKLDEFESIKNVMDDKDVSDADDLENYLDECADFDKYKKGFNELADFVEKIKDVIGHCGDDIPSTDVEDYD